MDFIKQLQQEKLSLLKRIDAIDLLLKSYNISTDDNVESIETDKVIKIKSKKQNIGLQDASMSQKLLLVLKEHQRFMKMREIGDFIVSEIGGDADDLVKKLSRRTRKLKELGKITKYQVSTDKRNAFWGSPNWLDENGEIIEKYMYDMNSIKKKIGSNLLDL